MTAKVAKTAKIMYFDFRNGIFKNLLTNFLVKNDYICILIATNCHTWAQTNIM